MRETRTKKNARISSTKNGAGNLDYVIYWKYADVRGTYGYNESFARVCKGHKEPTGIPVDRIVEKVIFRNGEEIAVA